MIPVIMLVINIGAPSSDFLTLLCLIMARPSLQHIPVIYLMGVAVMVIVLIPEARARFSTVFLTRMLNDTIFTHLALSLLINIYATSIITLKAWCVHFDRVTGNLST